MRRRFISAILCAGLLAMAPLPVYSCGMLMEVLRNCVLPADVAQAAALHGEHCAAMAEPSAGADASVSGTAASCCEWSGAPLPDGKETSSKSKVEPAQKANLELPHERVQQPSAAPLFVADATQNSSPPDRLTLLCTLLI